MNTLILRGTIDQLDIASEICNNLKQSYSTDVKSSFSNTEMGEDTYVIKSESREFIDEMKSLLKDDHVDVEDISE